jgi:uncharacterized protein (DUF1015 family)
LILPTHRLFSGFADLTADRLATLLRDHFILDRIGVGAEAAALAWNEMETLGGQDTLAFGTVADGVWQTARMKSPEAMARLAADHSETWRSLGVSNHLLAPQLGAPTTRYVHLLEEVQTATTQRSCDLAVLVPPATMGHVEQIAGNLEKMPPKSTFFYPKLLSGLVFNSLKGN